MSNSGILENAKRKELFGTTLACILTSSGFDSLEKNKDRIELLKQVIKIGTKKGFDVAGAIKLAYDVLKENHSEEFLKNVKDVLREATK